MSQKELFHLHIIMNGGENMKFYDLSNHQGKINLNIDSRISDADAFIFKATEGTYFVDECCDFFVQQAIQMNKPFGVYHFLDKSDVIQQAEFFYNRIKVYVGEAILVLDYEAYGRQGAVKAKQFLDHLYNLTKVRAWIYMNESDSNEDNWNNISKDYGWWAAKYSRSLPNSKSNLFMVAWQYKEVPLDTNIFLGNQEAWNKYAKGDRE